MSSGQTDARHEHVDKFDSDKRDDKAANTVNQKITPQKRCRAELNLLASS